MTGDPGTIEHNQHLIWCLLQVSSHMLDVNPQWPDIECAHDNQMKSDLSDDADHLALHMFFCVYIVQPCNCNLCLLIMCTLEQMFFMCS